MATNPVEDEFQEEVLRLFALEALEWIRQVKAALLELEGAPAQERIQTLYDVILRSLTNLKGSAATVELPCIENLTFTLVPLLQRMQGKKMSTTSPQYAALRQGLEALSSAIQMLSIAETKTAVMAELESISRRQAEAVQAAIVSADAKTAGAAAEDSATSQQGALIEALMALKRPRSPALEHSRSLVEGVLRKIHGADNQETKALATAIKRMMQELEALDVRFLEEARQRATAIGKLLSGIKNGAVDSPVQKNTIEKALHEIALLHEASRTADAGGMEMFLHGLESLLLDLHYKRIKIPPQKFQTVTSRVDTLLSMAQRYVEEGRAERKAIDEILSRFGANPGEVKKQTGASVSVSS